MESNKKSEGHSLSMNNDRNDFDQLGLNWRQMFLCKQFLGGVI